MLLDRILPKEKKKGNAEKRKTPPEPTAGMKASVTRHISTDVSKPDQVMMSYVTPLCSVNSSCCMCHKLTVSMTSKAAKFHTGLCSVELV